MAKVWLAVALLGWIAFAAGITYVGGTETGDWEYALSTGLKRLGYVAAISAAAGLVVGGVTFLFSGRGRRDRAQTAKMTALAVLGAPLLVGAGTMSERSYGRDAWFVLPGQPSWLVSSLERRNPDLEIEDLGEDGVAIYNAEGQRVTFWPWQLRHARIGWRKCEAADLEGLGAVRADPPANCAHRVRVEAPSESFTTLAFSLGDADPDAAVAALQKGYERLGGSYPEHLVLEQGGVKRRIESRRTRRWGNWVYVEVIDSETASARGGCGGRRASGWRPGRPGSRGRGRGLRAL